MNNLPYRFREQQFRRFESLITTAVNCFPQRYDVNPVTYSMAATTLSCRLRDAMNSLKENRWSTTVDMEKFDRIWPGELKVGERNTGLVVTGDKDTIRDRDERREIFGLERNQISAEPITFTNPSPSAVHTIVKLAEARTLTGQVRLVGVTETLLRTLAEQHDISYEKQPDGSFLLI